MSESRKSLSISTEQAEQIFGSTEAVAPTAVRHDDFESLVTDITIRFADTRLGLEDDPDALGEDYFVTGNTVPRLCGAMGKCAANMCGLADSQMSMAERFDADCAVANTAEVFAGEAGFMLTPTNNQAVFMWDEDSSEAITITDETGSTKEVFQKVKPGSIFVFGKDDLPAEVEDSIFVGANNADNSLIVATTEVEGMSYAMVASSSRLNLGDREPDDQIFRKAIDGILDHHGLTGDNRSEILAGMRIEINVGYSAGLKNFKHNVRLPEKGSEAADKLIAANGLAGYEELTPTIVMSGKEGQYPGALDRGEVYGAFEAENDIDAPRSASGCPGFGEYCYIHYPKITQRTIVDQLKDMGLDENNIFYDATDVIDPASVNNRLASNRRMDIAGVPVPKTLRSVNGALIKFTPNFVPFSDR